MTYFDEIKQLDNGIQIVGSIKAGENAELSDYSVNHIINLYKLSDTPMVGRVGDPRVGYFYHNSKIETTTQLTGNPVVIIDRMNIDKAPWTYVIDTSIPAEYHNQIKSGVLSWNTYFSKLGLGEPFKVLCHDDPDYPKVIDVFDTKYWYIVGTNADNFNGPYSGFSMNIHDYRSGEILFGMISLNLTKIISNPTRYLVMNGANPSDKSSFNKYFDQYISWVTTHEVGHQLGLRHNFMGVFSKDNVSTAMDYVDVFNDLTSLKTYNPWGSLREYDLIAIEYGYIKLEGEKNGIKHPLLSAIIEQLDAPFGTDENNEESINPLVGTSENTNDPLLFVEEILPLYQKYRKNLLDFVKNRTITSYEYNTMFLYLYTQKYTDIAGICLKYIGGRYYDKNRTYFLPIKKDNIVHAIKILLKLLSELEYSDDEYKYIIYDYSHGNERQLFNRIKSDTIYSLNIENLYQFYQSIVNNIFKDLLLNQRIIRLTQNRSEEFYPIDLLYNFTFAYKTGDGKHVYDIYDINGIFPEIGAFLADDGAWQTLLLNVSPLKYNQQYSWAERLVITYNTSKSYNTKDCVLTIIRKIREVTDEHILPYVKSYNKKALNVKFWKNPHEKLLSHWSIISELLKIGSSSNEESKVDLALVQ
jgi:hypothetical protein